MNGYQVIEIPVEVWKNTTGEYIEYGKIPMITFDKPIIVKMIGVEEISGVEVRTYYTFHCQTATTKANGQTRTHIVGSFYSYESETVTDVNIFVPMSKNDEWLVRLYENDK